MAKKKPTAKKKKAKKASRKKAPSCWLVTGFLDDYLDFLTKPNPKRGRPRLWAWPPSNPVAQAISTSLGSVADVVKMLGTSLASGNPSVPDPGGADPAFLVKVAARVNAYPWPGSSDYDGEDPFGFPKNTVNMYEIARVADRMLHAISAGGEGSGSGPGSGWPPVR